MPAATCCYKPHVAGVMGKALMISLLCCATRRNPKNHCLFQTYAVRTHLQVVQVQVGHGGIHLCVLQVLIKVCLQRQ